MECIKCKNQILEEGIIYIRYEVDNKWGSHPVCIECWNKDNPDRPATRVKNCCMICTNQMEDNCSSTKCDDCIRADIKPLIKIYNDAEESILALADDMTNSGSDCNCGDTERFDYISYGEYREMNAICLNCGGFVDVME